MIKHADTVLPSHLKAMNAIRSCRTPDSGELYVQCPDCNHTEWRPLSCGHRSCPQCQNHEASQWIDRQQGQIITCSLFFGYFYIALSTEVINLALSENSVFYLFPLLLPAPLKDFGLNSKKSGGGNRYDHGIAHP